MQTNTIAAYTPSIIVLNHDSQYYVDNANVQIAPWVMGAFTDLFLQGILTAQMANYFNFHDTDGSRRRFMWLVITLGLLCLLKTSQNIIIVWDTVIATFANPDLSKILIITRWMHNTTTLSTAIIATTVQSFFVYRYWMLTRKWHICVLMVVGMAISLLAATLVIVSLSSGDQDVFKKWSTTHFVTAIIVDLLITIGTAWHLHSHKSSVKTTSEIIDRLVRMTWQTALPPTLCVIVNAIVLVVKDREWDKVHLAFNMTLPKLYAIALMYTLNMRNDLRTGRSHAELSTTSRAQAGTVDGKRTFVTNVSVYNHHGGNGRMSMGGTDATSGIPTERRGVSFIGSGNGRGSSFSGRLDVTRGKADGIHVETHVSRDDVADEGSSMELQPYAADETKAQLSV